MALLRALSRFLRQIRLPYSQGYMSSTLVAHSGIAGQIVELFQTRFDPREKADARKAREAELAGPI